MNKSLRPFFNPRGIIVVGATKNNQKLGFGLAKNIIDCGYTGNIYFVNPKGGNLFEKEIFNTISDVPEKSDLAVLLISSKFVLKALEECNNNGISSVIISSGGFKEIGGEGIQLENSIKDFAKINNMRIMGPNCIGLLDSHLPLNTTFLQKPQNIKGDISFISHSGAICAAILNWSAAQGFGFSKLVSLGNQMDINENDILDYISNDEKTKVITLYLEGVSNGRRFVKTAQEITKNTPVIVHKVGRFESGQKAVASHTGALAGQETAFNAGFRRAGVLRADNSKEMFEWAQTLSNCMLPKSNRVAILTNAGGPGVTAADSVENHSLLLSSLSQATKNSLLEFLPESASVQNPVDMLASASAKDYSECLEIVLKDPEVDMVMVILPPPPMLPAEDIVRTIIPLIKENPEKPIVVVPMGGNLIEKAVKLLRENKIPEYRFPEDAASSLAALVNYSKIVDRKDQLVIKNMGNNFELVSKIISKCNSEKSEVLGEEETRQIMQAYNIPVLGMELATNQKEVSKISEKIGFPIVMKISSPDIPHKSDIDGVLLNIKSSKDAEDGYIKLLEIAKIKAPNAIIEGVHIQKMINFGQEVILGAVQDLQFGPIIMFGSGGTEVEGLNDTSFSLAPVVQDDINFMFNNTWAGKKLNGFRNILPADKKSVEECIINLGHLVNDFPEIAEIEINPLRVLDIEKGSVAVDVRIRLGKIV